MASPSFAAGRLTDPPPPGAEALELATLFDVSQVLGGTGTLRDSLSTGLQILAHYHGVPRSAVTLMDEGTDELYIEASYGLDARGQQARYQLGEGITGRVVATATPIVVPDVSREPRFLHRTAHRNNSAGITSFLCVPIVLDHRPVGALSIDLPWHPHRDLDRVLKYLHVVSSLIALALKTTRPIDAERASLREENLQLKQELQERYDFSRLLGTSAEMRDVYGQIAQVATASTTVLIRGESGTGKELIAHALHYNSARARGPFIKVNCAALPETLIESELFGHERGAFTGALARRKGRFELAAGGTLFLDEIGELTPSTQVKLLRVLQEREFERLGGTVTLEADVRVIAATNRDLERAIAERAFREDLYYRLNVFPIFVPPLRERKPDILLLADHFVGKFAKAHRKVVKRITSPAIDMLMSYHWPGNVRELENIIERAVVVCEGPVIHGRHLPPTLQTAEASGTAPPGSLAGQSAALERDLIQDALKSTGGNQARAARQLHTTERILRYKVRKLGIDPRRFA
jgi:Nif-specific regulatory protein